ncbi:MAG: recombinase family protein [Campylobacterales bacterium]|nr:recombinase family protein [Campylobacterales bacterium]
MTYAYLRQIPQHSNLSQQQHSILSFALTQGLNIEKEVVEHSSKNRPVEERQQFEAFLHSLQEGDCIIIDSLPILTDYVEELVKLINCMLSRGIRLYVAASKTMITKKTPLVEVFPLLNDLREAQKAKTGQIGRPKGSRSVSKFDKLQSQIIASLKEGMSVSAIARELDVSRSSLKDYIESRGIRELIEGAWVEIDQTQKTTVEDNQLLICPFEKTQTEKQFKERV